MTPLDNSMLFSPIEGFNMEGYASKPGATIDALVYRYKSNEWNVIGSTLASEDEISDRLYFWSVMDLGITHGYWRPIDYSAGIITWRALIKGQQEGYDMPTFTQAGRDCLISERESGATEFEAGMRCHTGTDITLTTTTVSATYPDIDWFLDFNHAITTASIEGKLVFQFDAPNSSPGGNRMRTNVFPNSEVKAVLFQNFVAVRGYRDYCPTGSVWFTNPKVCIWNPDDWNHWTPYDNEPLSASSNEYNVENFLLHLGDYVP
jgi:hypothetical protein